MSIDDSARSGPPTPPLDQRALEAALGAAGAGDWSVRLLAETASTNAAAAADPVARQVVVAEHQTAGRGRLDRVWVAPPGTCLTFSAVVDPQVPTQQWPLLPLVAGLATARGVRRLSGLASALKWPNDVLVEDRKLAGILVERVQPGENGEEVPPLAVVGIGINVALPADQLPVPGATSLVLEGHHVDRAELLGAVLAELDAGLALLRSDPPALLAAYRGASATVGRTVEVHLPDDSVLVGTARAIDDQGRLVVEGPDGETRVGAGDVVHVRRAVS